MTYLVCHSNVLGAGCCEKKVVGGSTYTLIGEEDTSTFSCMDECTYSKEGEANSKYCFAAGDLQVECKGSSSANAGGAASTSAGGAAPTTADGAAQTTAGLGRNQNYGLFTVWSVFEHLSRSLVLGDK